ncbi:MAG: hypothetical protein KDA42_02765 [Planctomycetales bacterium]|nr:hypothetical protein [Planctomycetales bacterium]
MQVSGSLVKYPARVTFLWYLGLVVLGGLLLARPFCCRSAEPVTALDAVFTSTSACCVTGLAVRSTEHDFSLAGQIVILVLIQLGGIGIMTVTTFLMTHVGRADSLRDRAVIAMTLGADAKSDLRSILRGVLLMTVCFEGCGFVILAIRNLFDYPPAEALWQALFHSISAFCNAGFALHDDSLMRYRGDPVVNATICALVVIGGLGFPVIFDVLRQSRGPRRGFWDRLQMHSKIMLMGTAGLLAVSTGIFMFLESEGLLRELPVWQWPMVAMFHSVSCRTAGFNTIDLTTMTNATLFFSMLIMAIGAGPCSTAGGLKVSTVVVLLLQSLTSFRGYQRINIFRRTIPRSVVNRAIATTMLFVIIAGAALTILMMFEQAEKPHIEAGHEFMDASFEVASALGTVGLSTGITGDLTQAGRVIVILLMFLGRLGPISVFVALSLHERTERIEMPAEEPLIG